MTRYVATTNNITTIFELYYQRALNNPSIRKPISWALYQTWKEYDTKEKTRKMESEDA